LQFSYIHLQQTATGLKIMDKGKRSFEQHIQDSGIIIKVHHADNGVFQANEWVATYRGGQEQTTTFATVGADHLNGITEQQTGKLHGTAQSMLINANHRWKGSMAVTLWLYALRMANDTMIEVYLVSKIRTTKSQNKSSVMQESTLMPSTGNHSVVLYILDSSLQNR
jgi:hypothetical protein